MDSLDSYIYNFFFPKQNAFDSLLIDWIKKNPNVWV